MTDRRMSDAETAQAAMHKGQGYLSNLAALLQVMEIAAAVQEERISSPIDIDWWGLISLARRELSTATEPLESADAFLNGMVALELKRSLK